jgi:glycosyltransferase involved in cell wall biosynthesis
MANKVIQEGFKQEIDKHAQETNATPLQMKYLQNKNILIISPEPWNHIPVSKHHYARILAKSGNQVYFLNPPSTNNKITRDETYPGIFVVDYVTYKGLNKMPSFLRNILNKLLIAKIRRLCETTFEAVWSFDPFRFQNLHLFDAEAKIYHTVDVHVSKLEMEVAKTSSLILAVSQKILDKFAHLTQPKRKINHGLGTHFLTLTESNSTYNNSARPKIGYVGNLDNWCIDNDTLLTIVRQHPEAEFNFIGPYREQSPLAEELSRIGNCRLIGRVPSEELPLLLKQYDLFLMCYRGDEADINSNHHKILEYLATGKPLVINFTDEYKDVKDIVVMSQYNHELPALFSDVLGDLNHYSRPELADKRKQFARSNSYLQHVATIDSILSKIFYNGQSAT